MKAILQIGLAAFFGIILTTVASADTKRYGPFEFDTANPDILRLVGPIDLRSALVFRRALDSHPGIETLTLNSVGGSVYTALLIADDVHRAKLTTYIPPSSRCYSACAFIFLAGHTRRIHGNLGVHQISSAGISDEKNLQINLSDIVAAFNKFSINPKILEYMLRTSPDDIYIFSHSEILELELGRVARLPKGQNSPYGTIDDNYVVSKGRQIRVVGERGNQKLLIDGDVYYENKEHNQIYIWELAQLKSIDVIFGKSSTGGSQCFSGTNFVLSVQEQHPPRFDAIDGCAGLDHQIGDDSIRFWYDATPWYQGKSWIWTPKDGFGPFETVMYQPDLAKDWTYLRKQEYVDPRDLFYYPVIARQIYALIGNERSEILYSILGPGDGEFRGDYYVGKACQAHSCGNKSIIIADIKQKKVFIAWKSYKESVVTYPHLSNWPETYRRELADWEKELGKGDRWPSVAAELPAAAEPQAKAVPSFDCNRARAGDEIAICFNSKLSEMDNLTAAGFAFVRLEHGKSEATRVGRPLLRARQACGSDTSCILRRQIEAVQLYQSLGAPIILPHWVGAR